MPRIRIHRHAGCAKCARYARMHNAANWLGRVETTTETPPGHPPLRMGQVVVSDIATGRLYHGVDAFEQMTRHLPLYRLARPLRHVPAFRRYIERELAGDCDGEACAV